MISRSNGSTSFQSFPSPCGVLVLKLPPVIHGIKSLVFCFRPLAGFWFLNHYSEKSVVYRQSRFPSPCGVLVLKFPSIASMRYPCVGFRPLAGFWFLNCGQQGGVIMTRHMFPSPCGVLVLKYLTAQGTHGGIRRFPSPCGVLVLKLANCCPMLRGFRVSVPLRGSGS